MTPPVSKRFFVPEVIQTSAMDCGPASLKAILEGFGIPASYGRLREACQTSVDGTSVDTLEDVAVQLGLDAEQIMLPADHLLLEESEALPALVVVRLPNGLTHFVVVWSHLGPWVQVMNPAAGRRWLSKQRFLDQLFIHEFPVPASMWRDWAGSEGFRAPLQRRMAQVQVEPETAARWISQAVAEPGWRPLASLDAATRMVTALVQAKGLAPGEEATRVLERIFLGSAGLAPDGEKFPIPGVYWSVSPVQVDADEPHLLLRGAVLVRVNGVRTRAEAPADAPADQIEPLPPELVAALEEPPARPGLTLLQALREDGLLTPGVVLIALATAALGVTVQALLLQGLLRIGMSLNLTEQRWAAAIIVVVFLVALAFLQTPLTATILRMGRRMEARLRIALLEKIPRLSDRYFHSRLTSDMAQRAHGLRSLRTLPTIGMNMLNLGFQLILTTVGVMVLQPQQAFIALLATLAFMGFSALTAPLLQERDMRLVTHTSALSRFYLDALLGLIPLRMHSAERAFRREHETLLVEWVRVSTAFTQIGLLLSSISALLYAAFSIWILFNFLAGGGEISAVLLLFYWTLNLPALGQALVQTVQQYPMLRNRTLRLLEPLGAPDEAPPPTDAVSETAEEALAGEGGVAVAMEHVTVQIAGHTILSDIHFALQPGEHLAIVGPSGAGKSTLVGVLLGWHTPARGRCLVEGTPLTGERLHALRRITAWVDPAVQLWNRSLLENLTYGNANADGSANTMLIEEADLFEVLERLENGLLTPLGESGGLVSGGEGQRVRLGRALNREHVRLVVLDEPFRGLDRAKRRQLLKAARQHWREATLICVTHDVGETQAFERVLVVENGRIVEAGNPAVLATQPESRYHALLEAEKAVRQELWQSAEWRRLWIDEGKLKEGKTTPQSKR